MSTDRSVSPIGGKRWPKQNLADRALHDVEEAVRLAVASDNGPSLILGHVANGLTGQMFGPVERASQKAMTAGHLAVVEHEDDVRAGASYAVVQDEPLTLDLLTRLQGRVDGRSTIAAALADLSAKA